MRQRLAINRHLNCTRCGYDLFGSTLDGNCPECGSAARNSVLVELVQVDDAGHERQSRLHVLAGLAGYPVDAFLIVADVMRKMLAAIARDDGGGHGTAAVFVATFRDHCRTYFADEAEAVDLLGEWGLRSSEDVGRVVYAMVEVGLFIDSSDDRIEDFDGLFTLDGLFSQVSADVAAGG